MNEIASNPNFPIILIVDDEPFNQMILAEILKRNGCEIRLASDGTTALQLAEEEIPDVILLDIMMPDMDGYEVCQRLKETPTLCDIPVIFVSSLNETKDIVKALKFGGADYITKPYNVEEVTARVNTHLKLQLQSKELLELNASLKAAQDQLNKFAAHLLVIREEERILLSNQIHDKVGQVLIALKIDMGLWKKKVLFLSENPRSQEVVTDFNELVNIVDNTIDTVRSIISELKSDDLELLGFIETAKLYCIEFEIINKTNCSFESSIPKLVFDEQQKVALYRILQEAFSNIIKHAYATSVMVSLYMHEQNFVMEVKDNGVGYDESKKPMNGSFGLLDMKERVKILEGKLTITGKPRKGTSVKVEMPYPDK